MQGREFQCGGPLRTWFATPARHCVSEPVAPRFNKPAGQSYPRLSLSVLLHCVIALGRARLVVGGLALTTLSSGARIDHALVAEQHRVERAAQSTIEPRNTLPADVLRGGEQVELVSIEVRSAPCLTSLR